MNWDLIQNVITSISLFGNVGGILLAFKTMRSSVKKDAALAKQEEANSVVKSQEIYDRLTLILDANLDRMDKRIKMQDLTIDTQNQQIVGLKRTVTDYQRKCELCENNKATP